MSALVYERSGFAWALGELQKLVESVVHVLLSGVFMLLPDEGFLRVLICCDVCVFDFVMQALFNRCLQFPSYPSSGLSGFPRSWRRPCTGLRTVAGWVVGLHRFPRLTVYEPMMSTFSSRKRPFSGTGVCRAVHTCAWSLLTSGMACSVERSTCTCRSYWAR